MEPKPKLKIETCEQSTDHLVVKVHAHRDQSSVIPEDISLKVTVVNSVSSVLVIFDLRLPPLPPQRPHADCPGNALR